MALFDILGVDKPKDKLGLSDERVKAAIPEGRKIISFWRDYPDLFVDFMAQGTNFRLFFYQRVFLRAAMRHRYFYAVYPRAYSKSFLTILILLIRCILYPNAKLFVTSGGKAQAAGIIKEKFEEICQLIPAFEKEIDFGKGKTTLGKDYARINVKGGSYFDNIAANEKSRGKRRQGLVGEECVGIDGKILSEVLLPILNISRNLADGTRKDIEKINKSQIMITTAGYKNTFAYDKLIQFLIWSIIKPDESLIVGGTWRIPVLVGLQSRNFIKDLKADGTFNESSFEREYESIWSGSTEGAFFSSELIDKHRKLLQPEYEYSKKMTKNGYYVISVDVGRRGCESVASIIKVSPQSTGTSIKALVNMFTYSDTHFEDQAIHLKKLYYKFRPKALVMDGNGLGIGLIDYMVKSQTDPETGETIPSFGIINDEEGYYKKYETDETTKNAIYIIKANASINTEAHSNIQNQLSSGKIKMLIDERTAKIKLLNTNRGANMTPEERQNYLRPFTLTSVLQEEMLNLKEDNEGPNIILKPSNKTISKDKFSSLEYGLYYIKKLEDGKKKRKIKLSDFMVLN